MPSVSRLHCGNVYAYVNGDGNAALELDLGDLSVVELRQYERPLLGLAKRSMDEVGASNPDDDFSSD